MISKKAYILVGDDLTGKTNFQKRVIWHLCDVNRTVRLLRNKVFAVSHRDAPRKFQTLFAMNRSFQEKLSDYISMENYFANFFKDANVCIMSSHSHGDCIDDIRSMKEHLEARYYDVSSVYFSNHLNAATSAISRLNWSQRIVLNNPHSPENWEDQINDAAQIFTRHLIKAADAY